MTETIHFNTGAPYTRNGQRITATLHDDGVVTFHDHDRMISGEYTPRADPIAATGLRPMSVMRWYGAGHHTYSARADQDAFYEGGCNSTYDKEREIAFR